LKWSSQAWPARRTAPAFVWAGTGKTGPVCGARGFASQAKLREATGLRPVGTTTRLWGASLYWDWANPKARGPHPLASSQQARPVDRNRRSGAPRGARPALLAAHARWRDTLAPRVRGAALLGAPLPSFVSKRKRSGPNANPGRARAAGRRTHVRFSCHSGARAPSAFTRVFDALWRANPESRSDPTRGPWIPGPRVARLGMTTTSRRAHVRNQTISARARTAPTRLPEFPRGPDS
jgi:hypothetical protein